MAEKPNGSWVRLQSAAWLDPAVIAAKPMGELLFYRSIMFSRMTGSAGYIHPGSLPTITRDLYKGSTIPARLIDEGLWTPDTERGGFSICAFSKYNPDSTQSDDVAPAQRRNSGRKPPVKPRRNDDTETPHARSNGTDGTDNGPDRTPSGPVRSGPAQAVPRDAEGAAQPAPGVDGVCSGDEARRRARTIAEQAAKSNRRPPIVEPADPIPKKSDPEADKAFIEKLMSLHAEVTADE